MLINHQQKRLVVHSNRGEEDNEWNGPKVAIEDRMSLSKASPLIR